MVLQRVAAVAVDECEDELGGRDWWSERPVSIADSNAAIGVSAPYSDTPSLASRRVAESQREQVCSTCACGSGLGSGCRRGWAARGTLVAEKGRDADLAGSPGRKRWFVVLRRVAAVDWMWMGRARPVVGGDPEKPVSTAESNVTPSCRIYSTAQSQMIVLGVS